MKLDDEIAPLHDALTKFLRTAPGEMQTVTIQGVECLQGKPSPEVPLITLGRRQDYLMLTLGEGSFEALLARAETGPPTWLTDAVESLRVPRPAVLSYVNLASISKLALQADPKIQHAMGILGLDTLQATISMSGLDETGFVTRTKVLSTDPNRGLGALVSDTALVPDDVSVIPADATLAAAARFDAAQALKTGLQLVEDFDERAAADVRQQLVMVKQDDRCGYPARSVGGTG